MLSSTSRLKILRGTGWQIDGRALSAVIALAVLYLLFGLADPSRLYNVFQVTEPIASVNAHGLTWSQAISWIVGWSATTYLGYRLIAPWLESRGVGAPIAWLGGLCVGYPCSLAIIRIVSLLVPMGCTFIPVIAALLIVSRSTRSASTLTEPPARARPVDPWSLALGALLTMDTIALFLVIQVHAGDFSWVGHGPGQYAWYLSTLRNAGSAVFFPILPQHQDDLLYHYFLEDLFPLTYPPLLPIWITLALVKTSAVALVYGLFRALKLTPVCAIVFTGFLFFGTAALDPFKYLLIFDSANPLFQIVHAGRIVGATTAMLILTDVLDDGDAAVPPARLSRRFFLLAGSGLALTSVSNSVGVLAVFGIAALARMASSFDPSGFAPVGAGLFTGRPAVYLWTVGWLSPALAYGLAEKLPPGLPLLAGILAAAITVGMLIRLAYTAQPLRDGLREHRALLSGIMVFLLSSVAVLLLLGNLFVDNPLSRAVLGAFHQLGLFPNVEITDPFRKFLGSGGLASSRFFVDAREIGPYNEYNQGFVKFLAYYGGYFLVILLSLVTVDRAVVRTPRRAGRYWKWAAVQLTLLSTLSVFLFHTDFVQNSDRPWIKTRFLEIPFFVSLMIGLVLLGRTGKSWRRWILAWLVALIAAPILGTDRLAQWSANARLLLTGMF